MFCGAFRDALRFSFKQSELLIVTIWIILTSGLYQFWKRGHGTGSASRWQRFMYNRYSISPFSHAFTPHRAHDNLFRSINMGSSHAARMRNTEYGIYFGCTKLQFDHLIHLSLSSENGTRFSFPEDSWSLHFSSDGQIMSSVQKHIIYLVSHKEVVTGNFYQQGSRRLYTITWPLVFPWGNRRGCLGEDLPHKEGCFSGESLAHLRSVLSTTKLFYLLFLILLLLTI